MIFNKYSLFSDDGVMMMVIVTMMMMLMMMIVTMMMVMTMRMIDEVLVSLVFKLQFMDRAAVTKLKQKILFSGPLDSHHIDINNLKVVHFLE